MNRDSLDFGGGKIAGLFRALFFPTLVGMVFNSVLNICDGMFVGHGVGSNALAAINIVAPLFLACIGIGLMFGAGASVIGSIRLAEKNLKAARIIMTQAYVAGAVIFAIIIIISLIFTNEVLYGLGCSPALEHYAKPYLLWLLPGLFFLYLQCVGMMLIRLDGSPKYAMAVQVVCAVINIFLDWLMVYPMGMGITGAAIATSLSCIIGGSMVLVYFLRLSSQLKFYKLKVSIKSLRLSLRNVGYMARIGTPTFLAEITLGTTMITGNFLFMRYLGEDGVAAFSVGCYLFPIMFSINEAVALASQPIISFNYGANSPGRVRQTLRLAIATAVLCGAAISVAMGLGAKWLVIPFLPSESPAFTLAANGLPIFGSCAILFAINITFIGYYQSIEQALRSSAYTLLKGVFFLIPCFIILPHVIGTPGLWAAVPSAELLTLLLIIIFYRAQTRRKNSTASA